MSANTASTLFLPAFNLAWVRRVIVFLMMLTFGTQATAQTSLQPLISSLSVTSGSPGTIVVVSGQNLSGVISAAVNGVNATFTIRSATRVAVKIPVGATTGRLTLKTSSATVTSPTNFTVTNAATANVQPMISGFTPTSGPAGTVVTVRGSGFTGTSAVGLGKDRNLPYTVVNDSTITFTVSATASTASVNIVNPGFTAFSPTAFTVTAGGPANPTPVINSFTPTSGPVGTVITVTGTGFSGVTGAFVGGSALTPVSNVTSTSLTFVVPASAGTGPIRVTNGTNNAFSFGTYTVTTSAAVPTVSGFSPASGPVGTVITVSGTGFTGATSASIGGGTAVAVSNVSSTSLTFTVPSGAASGTIRVSNASNSGTSAGSFTVTVPAVVPAITSFSPTSGPVGTVVTVTGTGFTGATSASIGGGTAVAVSNVTSTSLTFTVPSGATSGTIRISNASNSGTSAGSFTVTVPAAVPAITSFSPTSGPVGTVVTVTGTGFTGATSASIGGGTAVAVSNVTSTSLTFTVPSGAASGTIRVSNASNSGTSAGSFTVTVPAVVPAITSFSPTSGPVGTVITVSGSNFIGATSAAIGSSAAVAVSNVTSTSLTFTVPSGATSGTIRVSNAANSSTSAASFSVTTVAPPPAGGAIGQEAAARLLTQGTFGPTLATVDAAAAQSYDAWFAAQLAAPISLTLPNVPNKDTDWVPFWWRNVVTGPDQLRQRTAFALSQIFVVSDQSGAIMNQSQTMAAYYDMLASNAFGNYRTLLEKVTLSPTMGLFLNMFRNNKEDLTTGVHADQNYAREIMQLFSVGLVQLNLDGTVRKDAAGKPLPTYTQADVEGMSKVFTGWASAPVNGVGESAWTYDVDYIKPMVAYAAHHDTSAKTIIGNVTVPAGGTAATDLRIALDTLFNHPNVGPFMATRLIQRMVTSNPSPQYVARVATVFNDNGAGVRGDLFAVVRAVLTDPEAVVTGDNTYGKLREPLLRLTHLWRAFSATDSANRVAEPNVLLMSSATFGQSVLSSPSVFNFFAPDYQRIGALSFADLVAPEFQITNENTLVLTSNMLQRLAYQYVSSNGTRYAGPNGYSEAGSLGAQSVLLKTAAWESFAATPATLVDRLNTVFMQGLMSATMRTTLINYINTIPATQPATRVIEATDLLVNSPQYAVQR